ncbi:protein NYNRIN-like [Macrobrachium rosenbergii]|uniref:protein NYNRIN-like n=1 Tax=Macrobrachium rosenbergii TaxID=79674 RepID=UPI0034D4B2A7
MREQAADPETADYRTTVTALKWEDVPLANSDTALLCDTSTGHPRPLVPALRRKQVFDIIHILFHPSGRTTARLMTDKFVWHGINKNVLQWARSCIPCHTSKTSQHTESGFGDFPQPRWRFGHIRIDVIGPLLLSGPAKYLLTIIDRTTHWPEATHMDEASTSCAEALLSSWISRFRMPDSITTDRGPAFLSELWVSLACLMGTTLHSTTEYNPAVNGMVEGAHHSLKEVEAHKIGPACADGCLQKVTMPMIEALFKDYWAMGNYNAQTSYLQKLMVSVPIKRRRKPAEESSHTQTILYGVM